MAEQERSSPPGPPPRAPRGEHWSLRAEVRPGGIQPELRALARRRGCVTLAAGAARALWLVLGVLIAVLALRLMGYSLSWGQGALLAGLAALVSLLAAARHRPDPRRLARRIDQRFRLQEHIATAQEIGIPTTEIEARLVAQARETLRQARRHPALAFRFPVREIETFLALLLVGGGLWIFTGARTVFPDVDPRALPPSVGEPAPPQPASAPNPNVPPDARDVLDQLASALGQNPLTREAGEALTSGDLAGAAAATRELADRLGELSPQEQASLADTLERAAEAIGENAPELSEALEAAADALRRGDTEAAADALEEAAQEIEGLGQPEDPLAAAPPQAQPEAPPPGEAQADSGQGAPQDGEAGEQGTGEGSGSGAGDGQGNGGSQPAQEPEAPPEGVPLELEPGDEGPPTTQPGTGDNTTGTAPGERGFQRGGAPSETEVETGSDPLRYPWELRGTIREYFR